MYRIISRKTLPATKKSGSFIIYSMATIKNLRDSWRKLNTNLVILKAVDATQPNYIELQKAQMYAGKTVTGETIAQAGHPYGSRAYATEKHSMNPLPGEGNPDLRLTGGYYDGIKTDVEGDKIEVSSTDEKWPELDKIYPYSLAGLGGKYKSEYLVILQPTIVKFVKNAL